MRCKVCGEIPTLDRPTSQPCPGPRRAPGAAGCIILVLWFFGGFVLIGTAVPGTPMVKGLASIGVLVVGLFVASFLYGAKKS